MKDYFKNTIWILLLIPTLAYSQLSLTPAISSVKNGVLDLDKSATVGNILDSWAACYSTHWEKTQTKRGQTLVTFYCKSDMNNEKEQILDSILLLLDKGTEELDVVDYAGGVEKNLLGGLVTKKMSIREHQKIVNYKELELFIQFQLNLDDTFEFKDSGVHLSYANGTSKSASSDRFVEGANPGCTDCTVLHSAYLDDNFTENGRDFLDTFLGTVYFQNQ